METEQIKLYDIQKKKFPATRCYRFRTLQVFKCRVCGALTNEAMRGGRFGASIVCECPNSSEPWHYDLAAKVEWLGKPHPKSYKAELESEISEDRAANATKVKNNVVGAADVSQIFDFHWIAIKLFGD